MLLFEVLMIMHVEVHQMMKEDLWRKKNIIEEN
jgi:hypothetical protein